MIKCFEHVGMVAADMDRSIAFYRDLLGLRLHLRKTMENGTEVAFLDTGGGMLEIFTPPAVLRLPLNSLPTRRAFCISPFL